MHKEINAMLEMMLRPALFVADGMIVKCNAAAHSLSLEEGAAIAPLLLTGQEEWESLQSGCLYLQMQLPGGVQGATVTALGEGCIFTLDQEDSELRALSLAAKELRNPVNSLLAISGTLLPLALPEQDPKVTDLLARMSRDLYRLQRILGNMSDAPQAAEMSCQEMQNIAQVFDDIFEKATAHLAMSSISIQYKGLAEDVFGLIDTALMERAVLNLLSNAAKFGGDIQACLTHNGSTLRLCIQDSGTPMGPDILGSLFQRYLRQPAIEDPRFGLGLGMLIIRAAAASHGGTVLVDHPSGTGNRITLTMKLRQADTCEVRSPRQDLTGGRDQALIELSQLLPASVYEKEL